MHMHNGNKKYKKNKCDPQKLEILANLRKRAGMSQRDVARFFDMADYGSVAAWELGKSKPFRKRRKQFIVYLLDKLLLRRNAEQFCSVWDEVMVQEWGWKPLSRTEWQHAFPGRQAAAFSLTPQRLSRIVQITDREVELGQLAQLLGDMQAVIDRLLDERPELALQLPELPSGVKRE